MSDDLNIVFEEPATPSMQNLQISIREIGKLPIPAEREREREKPERERESGRERERGIQRD